MKLLFDFFPVLLFFIAYKVYDIYVATVVAIVSSLLQVSIHRWRYKRYENMHLVTLALLIVFGGATLLLHDEAFIKWKPTILNGLFGLFFLCSQFIGEKSMVERMMGTAVSLPKPIWLRLNMMWVAFFIILGLANLYVIYHFDTDTWVNFKMFGMMGLTMAFVILQSIYLARYLTSGENRSIENNTDNQKNAGE